MPLAYVVVELLDAHAQSFVGPDGAFADRNALPLIPGTQPLIRALEPRLRNGGSTMPARSPRRR